MKRCLLFIMMAFLSLIVSAQGAGGQVRRPDKKYQATNSTPSKRKQNKSVEAAGYDVTITCNVPTAYMTIDGSNYGSANGSRFLKTGSHTILLNAEGYEPLTQSIVVNSFSRSLSFVMKEIEKDIPPVIQRLINNMILIEGGTIVMGATSEQGNDADTDEKPAHQITVSSFSIGKYEVTQEDWIVVMGSNPSYFIGNKRPVESVSWKECQDFIRKLNSITGKQFRLPTEAEWEYAARGGNQSLGYKYSGNDILNRVAWSGGFESHDVGQKSPNELGIYDMSGNVWEWCQDWYDSYLYGAQNNPLGPSSGTKRVNRGGGWGGITGDCRVSCRRSDFPSKTNNYLGLRLALSL